MRPVRLVARRYGFDLLIVLGSVVGALAVALRPDHTLQPDTATWLGALVAAAVPLPLLARQRAPFGAPLAVWALAVAASFVDGRLPVSIASLFVTGLAATFLFGALPDARAGRIGLAVALGGALVVVANDPGRGDTDYLFTPALFAVGWLSGLTARERARGAVLEERVRIARELHDVVAHHVSMIGVQAGAARVVLDRDPGKAKEALTTIEASSREAVTELHHLLGFLRRDGDEAGTAPAPGLSELPRLAASMADSNLAVDVRVEGEQRALPPTVDVSAYRIVQEALTNTLKHSAASRVDVRLRYRPDALEVVVVDDGRGDAGNGSATGGLGLVGMRERAAAHGGQLHAGPLDGGGYRVVVTLPTGGAVSIRVLLADDQSMVRAGFRMILESEPDLEVAGEAATGEQAVDAARRLRPDVVLMDIQMPDTDGLTATRRIASDTRVVILTTFERDDYVFEALQAGASGFLLKNAPPEELIHAVRVVAGGDALLAPSVTRRIIAEFARQPRGRAVPELETLTAREREVLVLLARGHSNAEVARELFVSEGTVKTHVSSLLSKLGLRDRVQAVVLAYESGLVTPGSI